MINKLVEWFWSDFHFNNKEAVIYTVQRKPDVLDKDGWKGMKTWKMGEAQKALDWINKYCPDSLVDNCWADFHFNNKDAAIMFKMVWG